MVIYVIKFEGLIFSTGDTDGSLRLWDISSQSNITTFDAYSTSVSSISFSENGYYLATSGQANSELKIWDLRKPALLKAINIEKEELNKVQFDLSGSYIGAVGKKTHIYDTKKFNKIASFSDHKENITDIKFGKNSKSIITTSMDRSMKIYTN